MLSAYLERRAALKFVNQIRREEGLRPLRRLRRGAKGISNACPIAASIAVGLPAGVNVIASTGEAVTWDSRTGRDRVRHSYNDRTRAFVSNFDAGHHPRLVAK